MKRRSAGLLTLLLVLGLLGCAGQMPQARPETVPETGTESVGESFETARTEAAETETVGETGELFLTASGITFSLVGESEDVYAGSVPREKITWQSDDEEVARIQDGVVTAVGVGQTTVRAAWGDSFLSCQVNCLAEDRETLSTLEKDVLHSPKRNPPEITEADPFFADAVFVGDSITYSLLQAETKSGSLGHPQFLCRGSASVNGFVRYFHNIYYQGKEAKLEDAVAATGAKKVFFMLGTNDVGYQSEEEILDNWDTLIGRILEKSPDTEIYLQSCFPEWTDDTESNWLNEKLAPYNEALKAYAQERGYHYVDVAAYIVDHTGRMATVYSLDEWIHLNPEGCEVWMQALNAYAYQREIGGEET